MSKHRRAAERRATWQGRVVEVGEPKGPSYAMLTVPERIAAFVQLNAAAWRIAGGREPAPIPRAKWPGQIFTAGRRD